MVTLTLRKYGIGRDTADARDSAEAGRQFAGTGRRVWGQLDREIGHLIGGTDELGRQKSRGERAANRRRLANVAEGETRDAAERTRAGSAGGRTWVRGFYREAPRGGRVWVRGHWVARGS